MSNATATAPQDAATRQHVEQYGDRVWVGGGEMSGTIFLDENDAWPVSGWLFRWVIDDLGTVELSTRGQELRDEARAVQALDLSEFSDADRRSILAAWNDSQIQRFSVGVEPGFDAGRATATLRDLHALAAKAGR